MSSSSNLKVYEGVVRTEDLQRFRYEGNGQTVYAGLVKRREVAAENGLEVVKGKIPLPDLRIEYQTRNGELAKVDLELATDHYKASQIAEKARAGFIVYSEGGGTKPEDRDFMSEILSL
jgi:hypothetical protein